MKLVATIESEFKKILLIGLGISLVAITTFSFFSAKELVEKASNFIESHISLLTETEVNFDNMSEIDRRIRQVYESWIRSQGIDLRIEVFIDERLVAKAGQLQRFGLLSFSTKREIVLPSGNHVKMITDVDLSYLTALFLTSTICVGLFLLVCFWQLRKRMRLSLSQISRPLEDRISWLQSVSSQLPESLSLESSSVPSSIDELAKLDESFKTFISRLRHLEKQVAEKSYSEGRIKMAEQVAHSLKGAVGTLGLLLENNRSLPNAVQTEIQGSIQKMKTISASMLSLRKTEDRKTLAQTDEEFDPIQIIESVIYQKRKLNTGVLIELQSEQVSHITLCGPRIDFETMISNIIDNSVDAMPNGGTILLSLVKKENQFCIRILDKGKGIPAENLSQLMQEGVTFKTDGNGLGLYHAKNTVDVMKGDIEISSVLGKETEVRIHLPIFSEKLIELTVGQQLVIVDDDSQIHRSWDILLASQKEKIDVVHILSEDEFDQWIAQNGTGFFGTRFYIFDYDLKSRQTGIDLIKKFDLRLEAVVISGMADDNSIAIEAQEAKIQIWNKSILHKIKVNVTELETQTPHSAVNL